MVDPVRCAAGEECSRGGVPATLADGTAVSAHVCMLRRPPRQQQLHNGDGGGRSRDWRHNGYRDSRSSDSNGGSSSDSRARRFV